jgi:hypothetical protein
VKIEDFAPINDLTPMPSKDSIDIPLLQNIQGEELSAYDLNIQNNGGE